VNLLNRMIEPDDFQYKPNSRFHMFKCITLSFHAYYMFTCVGLFVRASIHANRCARKKLRV